MENLQFRPNTCQVKFKMRAVASFNKLAGFPKLSGYKQANVFSPNIMAMNTQVKHIIDRISGSFSEFQEIRDIVIKDSPPASYDLLKEALFLRLRKDVTKEERALVMNTILSVIDETNFLFIDMRNYKQKSQERVALVGVFNNVCCAVCFLLGTF
jgi:hypothetical protein